jgi:hypothetical protein
VRVWPNWYGSGFRRPERRKRNWRDFSWHHGVCSHFTAWQIKFTVFGWHYYIVFQGKWIKRWGEKKRKEFLDKYPQHRPQ